MSSREDGGKHTHGFLLFKNLPDGRFLNKYSNTHHIPEELVFGWTLTAQNFPDHAVHITHVEPHPVQEAQQEGPSCADRFPSVSSHVFVPKLLSHIL